MAVSDIKGNQQYSKVTTKNVEELMDAIKGSYKKKEKIIIPKYQRKLVWSDTQKKAFIDSLKHGYPFGTLLLYNEGSKNQLLEYSLVDGLQRITTIMKYNDQPTKFFDDDLINEIDPAITTKIINLLASSELKEEELRSVIIKWIQGLKGFEETDGFSSYDLTDEIFTKLNLDRKSFNLVLGIVKLFVKSIKENSDISKIEIPINIYSGPQYNLPIIFERLNSMGTKLNKYQIYAATWSNYKINIINKEIKNSIKEKYEKLIEEGLEIEGYDPYTFDDSEFNVFEYVFGLGKYLSKKYPELFGSNIDTDSTESIGFNLCTVCLWYDINEMNKLSEILPSLDQNKFEGCLLNSIEIVIKQLMPFISLQSYKKKNNSVYHTEYQIVSLIGKVFRSKYDYEFNIKPTWENKLIKNNIVKNIPHYYLYDIISDNWRGSGDSKIKELVQDQSKYDLKISKENWNNKLNEWHDNQLLKKEKMRVKIKEQDLLFLHYLYTYTLSTYDTHSIKFHVDHIIPVNRLKQFINRKDIQGLPISAVSNLCLIPDSLNMAKGDSTIYEFYDDLVEQYPDTEDDLLNKLKEIEQYTFTSREDLEFIQYIDEERYIKFLKNRFDKMKNKFYSLNKIV